MTRTTDSDRIELTDDDGIIVEPRTELRLVRTVSPLTTETIPL